MLSVQGFLLSKPDFDFFVLYILLVQYLPIISLTDLQDFEDPIKDCNREIFIMIFNTHAKIFKDISTRILKIIVLITHS